MLQTGFEFALGAGLGLLTFFTCISMADEFVFKPLIRWLNRRAQTQR